MNNNHNLPVSHNIASDFLYKVFAWVAAGLSITTVTSFFVSNTQLAQTIIKNAGLFFVLFLIQLGLVLALSVFLEKLSYATASGIFVLYSILNGLTLSSIFLIYTGASLVTTFAIAACMFTFFALYGYFTKADLTSIGSILLMALVGLIIGMLVNLFLKNNALQYILSAVGVIVFSLLTAYDVQKIKNLSYKLFYDNNNNMDNRISILGALMLYLDFINLFLMILNFTGQRRD